MATRDCAHVTTLSRHQSLRAAAPATLPSTHVIGHHIVAELIAGGCQYPAAISPGHVIKIIDEEGNELPPGATGEIVGRSPIMMNGYHGQPAKSREMEWFDKDGHRYIRHGDVGRFDEDGFLILMDRSKDMIISGGFNIFPTDLEAELTRQPAVREAAVVGVPSDRWGETPLAVVVLADLAANVQAIMAEANRALGKTQRIARIEVVDELPRSPIGKVLKRELRDRFGGNPIKQAPIASPDSKETHNA